MISYAIQRGDFVEVYDEKNFRIATYFGELKGYTANSVSYKHHDFIYVFDDKGNRLSAYLAK